MSGRGGWPSEVPKERNGAVPVNIQDQHSLALDLYFIQSLGATTLNGALSPNDRVITLTDSTNFVDGDYIGIFSSTGIFYFGTQIGATVGNDITLDTPIDKAFLDGSNVIRATRDMNVLGAPGSIQIFQIGPVGIGTAIEVDITRIMGRLQDGSEMDDSLFGSLAALEYGIAFRSNNGVINNYWNVKTNGELALLCYDFTYADRAPAGDFGARFRNSYAGPAKHGVTIRLGPGDTLEMLVQDDLSGLDLFRMGAQGHVVTD